jgi:hypothetical protein
MEDICEVGGGGVDKHIYWDFDFITVVAGVDEVMRFVQERFV